MKIASARRVAQAFKDICVSRVSWITSALMGAAVVMLAIFNPGGLDIFEDPGSVADWVAGVGTWAVGYGAIAISIAARRREIADERRKEVDHLQARQSVLMTVLFRASPITSATTLARGYSEYKNPHPKVKLLTLRTAVAEAGVPKWDDLDLSVLDQNARAAFYELELCIRYFKTACNSLIYGLEEPDLGIEVIRLPDFLREVQELEEALELLKKSIEAQMTRESHALRRARALPDAKPERETAQAATEPVQA
ncbi:hypothetical protein [Stenotrophomonas lactitubi]